MRATGVSLATRLLRWLHGAENAVLALLALALIVLAATQIGLRNLGGPSWPWMEPLVRALVLWLGLLGALVATREGRHIRIDLLPRLLSPALRVALNRCAALFSALICALLAWHSLRMLADERSFGAIAFLGVPVWALQIALPVVFALMALRFLIQVLVPVPPSDQPLAQP